MSKIFFQNTDFLDNLDLSNITERNLPGMSADDPINLDEMDIEAIEEEMGPDPNIVIKEEKDTVEMVRGPSPVAKADPWVPPPTAASTSPKSPQYRLMSPDTTTKFYQANATLRQAARKLEVPESHLKELIKNEVLNTDHFTELEEYNIPIHPVKPERNLSDPITFMVMKSCDFCNTINPLEAQKQHIQVRCKSCKTIIPFDVIDIIHENDDSQVKEALQEFVTELIPKRKPRRQRKSKGTLEHT